VHAAVGLRHTVSPTTAVAPFRRLRDDETTAARLLSFERRKLITVKRINNWAHKEALGGTVGIYIAIRKIRPGIAHFFCSYAGHV